MEIYGKIVNEKGEPIGGAGVQRYYPTGENYSAVITSSSDGSFNGRVPDRDYYWIVSAPGYLPLPVSLANALHDRPDLPIIVGLEPDPVVATLPIAMPDQPADLGDPAPAWVWVAGGAAACAAALWFFASPREKVKLRKIL
jgi:hypothetical protein